MWLRLSNRFFVGRWGHICIKGFVLVDVEVVE